MPLSTGVSRDYIYEGWNSSQGTYVNNLILNGNPIQLLTNTGGSGWSSTGFKVQYDAVDINKVFLGFNITTANFLEGEVRISIAEDTSGCNGSHFAID